MSPIKKATRRARLPHEGRRFDHVPAVVRVDVQALKWDSEEFATGDIRFIPGPVINTFLFRTFEIQSARKEFMAITEPGQALSFFRKYSCAWLGPDGEFTFVTFTELKQVQEILRRVAVLPTGTNQYVFDEETNEFPEYLRVQLCSWNGFYLDVRGNYPVLECEFTKNAELIEAFGVLAAIERAAAVPNRLCARDDCRQIFPLKKQSTKIYCSEKCAHVMAMRMSRSRRSSG